MAQQHLIYHWKHGWIPLTHAAALSKAHGSAHLADRYVPGTSAHHSGSGTKLATRGKSARQIHAGLTPHTRTPSTAAEVSKLRPGDHATVTGMDQYGQTMTFTGRVHGMPTPVRIKHGHNGKVEPHIAVTLHNGSDSSGGDATARGVVYVPNPNAAKASDLPDSGAGPATSRDAFRMRADELKKHAAAGSTVAQTELDRRAAKRGDVPKAPRTSPPPAARTEPSKPAAPPKPATPVPAPKATPTDALEAAKTDALARWEAENSRLRTTLFHTIRSKVVDVQDGKPRGIHTQYRHTGERVGSVIERRDGRFSAIYDGKTLESFTDRGAAHEALKAKYQADLDAAQEKSAAAAAKSTRAAGKAASALAGWEPHQFQSDGTRAGLAAAAKIKQSFRTGNHVVHIETSMTRDQTRALLGDIHSVLLKANLTDAEGITFHVPAGDAKFRARQRRGTTGAYVRQGQRAVFINPKIANGTESDSFSRMGDHFMPAAATSNGRHYVLTHELGHILDNQHAHTRESSSFQALGREFTSTQGRSGASTLHSEHITQLSRYGRTNPQEGYAEAYAQWIQGGPHSSVAADAYAAQYGWAIPKWYREGQRR